MFLPGLKMKTGRLLLHVEYYNTRIFKVNKKSKAKKGSAPQGRFSSQGTVLKKPGLCPGLNRTVPKDQFIGLFLAISVRILCASVKFCISSAEILRL